LHYPLSGANYIFVCTLFGSKKMIEMPQNLVEMALKTMGDRWKVMIIQELMDGTKRFGEIKKELGDITQKVLTANLRALEEKGILIRTVYAQIPPKVEYTLTNFGYSLKPVLDSMREWAENYYNQNVKNLMPSLG
jgi:DNA-binding HxlR family transcriptional regulator